MDKDKDKRRVRITSDRLNSYGSRVLTEGMDVAQFQRNPVLLYMHERGNVIGYVEDIRKEKGEVTGRLVFDEASELSRRCKRQWEFGSLRMVSAGIDILELSEDRKRLVAGQTRPTVTRSRLFEVSLVDIGANPDAIVLKKDGEVINLGRDGECLLPLLNHKKEGEQPMEQKEIALRLGLPETAGEAAIAERLDELKAAKEEAERLRGENETLRLAGVTAAVERAVQEKRLGEDRRQQFIELGKKIGAEELEKTLAAMSPRVKLGAVIGRQGDTGGGAWSRLGEVPAERLAELRESRPEEYRRLYKAEYGMDCQI